MLRAIIATCVAAITFGCSTKDDAPTLRASQSSGDRVAEEKDQAPREEAAAVTTAAVETEETERATLQDAGEDAVEAPTPEPRRVTCDDLTKPVTGLALAGVAAVALPEVAGVSETYKVPSFAIDPRDPSVAYLAAGVMIARADVCRDDAGHVLAFLNAKEWVRHDTYEYKAFGSLTFSPDGKTLYANVPNTYRGNDEPLLPNLYVYDMTAANPVAAKRWCGGPGEGVDAEGILFYGMECAVLFPTATTAKVTIPGYDATYSAKWLDVLDPKAATFKAATPEVKVGGGLERQFNAVYALDAAGKRVALVAAADINSHAGSVAAYDLDAANVPTGAPRPAVTGLRYPGGLSQDPLTGDVFVRHYPNPAVTESEILRVSGFKPALPLPR